MFSCLFYAYVFIHLYVMLICFTVFVGFKLYVICLPVEYRVLIAALFYCQLILPHFLLCVFLARLYAMFSLGLWLCYRVLMFCVIITCLFLLRFIWFDLCLFFMYFMFLLFMLLHCYVYYFWYCSLYVLYIFISL